MFDLSKLAAGLDKVSKAEVRSADRVISTVEKTFDRLEENGYVSKKFSPGGYVCARWKAYERLHDFQPKMDPNTGGTLNLFRAGNNVHDNLQQHLLADTGKLFGNWKCPSCGHVVAKSLRPLGPCTNSKVVTDPFGESVVAKCADTLDKRDASWIYEELYYKMDPFNDPLFLMSGFSDGIWIEDEGWYIVEIKSSDQLTFDSMSKVKHKELDGAYVVKPAGSRHPIQTHVNQGMFYGAAAMEACRNGELPLEVDKFCGIILLYVCRNTFRIKEYQIEYNEHSFEEFKMVVAASKNAYEQGNAFLAPAKCSSANTVLAKKCPLRGECFPSKKKKKEKKTS